MEDQLLDKNEKIISVAIFDAIAHLSGNRIENILLDGTIHVQTVGEPLTIYNFRTVATKENYEKINLIQFLGEMITLKHDGELYHGKILNVPTWSVEIFGEGDERLYSSELSLGVER